LEELQKLATVKDTMIAEIQRASRVIEEMEKHAINHPRCECLYDILKQSGELWQIIDTLMVVHC
jgi:hypothetical protein